MSDTERLLPLLSRRKGLPQTCTVIVSLAIIGAVCVGLAVSLAGNVGSLSSSVFYRSLSADPVFSVICLGAGGGPFQNDLSGYLIGISNSSRSDRLPSKFGSFDGGTLLSGLQQADNNRLFGNVVVPSDIPLTRAGYVLTMVTEFFITHSHLDHLVGAIIDSTAMGGIAYQKGLDGLNTTLTSIQDFIFNSQIWANFGDTGVAPLYQFRLTTLLPGIPRNFTELQMEITAFPLVHASVTSTAFLIFASEQHRYMMYWGDVGPDSVQNVTANRDVWQTVAPLVRTNQLKAIIIECSYTSNRSDDQLFGHLTPKYLMEELHVLANFVQSPEKMASLLVLVSHIKPSLNPSQDVRSQIGAELKELNDIGVKFIFPLPGYRYDL